ncbi:membrane dipeptidase [Candidatus Bipolaricaulota bacterium]|nr:membrane dipeptidase [Candidatus Bipolaricaulota bacterium]
MKAFTGEANFLSGEGNGHVTLPSLLEGRIAVQIFACFVLSERYPNCEQDQAIAILDTICDWISASGGRMSLVETVADLAAPHEPGNSVAAILALEGGDPLRGHADNLRVFARRGVRLIIPAWADNPFSGTSFGTDKPLTPEGEKLIAIAEEEHVAIDVSHLSDRAFDDVARLATRPFLASHSNCRALCPHPRNLDNRRLHVLAERGGVLGINLSPLFLDPTTYALARPHYAALRDGAADNDVRRRATDGLQRVAPCDPIWVVRHIRHAIDIGGEDCVGLGGDLDGIPQLPAGFATAADYPRLIPLMERAGLGSRQIEKVCYGNFTRLFEQLLPDALPVQSW